MLKATRVLLTVTAVLVAAVLVVKGSSFGYDLYLSRHLPKLPTKVVVYNDNLPLNTPAEIARFERLGQLKKQADVAFDEQGNYRLALAIREQLLDLDPKDIESWHDQAWLAWSVYGDTERSLATRAFYAWYGYDALCRGVEANMRVPMAWASMGDFYSKLNLGLPSVQCYLTAVQLGGGPIAVGKAADIRKSCGAAMRRAGLPLTSAWYYHNLAKQFPELNGTASGMRMGTKAYWASLVQLALWALALIVTLGLRRATTLGEPKILVRSHRGMRQSVPLAS